MQGLERHPMQRIPGSRLYDRVHFRAPQQKPARTSGQFPPRKRSMHCELILRYSDSAWRLPLSPFKTRAILHQWSFLLPINYTACANYPSLLTTMFAIFCCPITRICPGTRPHFKCPADHSSSIAPTARAVSAINAAQAKFLTSLSLTRKIFPPHRYFQNRICISRYCG